MSASGLAIKAPSDVHRMDGSTASARVNIAPCAIEFNAAGTSMGPNAGPDVRYFQTARTGVGIKCSRNSCYGHAPRAAGGVQLRAHRNHKLIADRYIPLQLGIVNMADADVVATLLDWRVVFQPFHSLVGVSAEPVVGPDVTDNSY